MFACFFLTPTLYAREVLRSSSAKKCPLGKYHQAEVDLGVIPLEPEEKNIPKSTDLRWPSVCTCGYKFEPSDFQRYRLDRLYLRSDHLALHITLPSAPVGAMWYEDWHGWKGPDGHCLVVLTPDGLWFVDSGQCTRSGELPEITVTAKPQCQDVTWCILDGILGKKEELEESFDTKS